MQQSRVSTYLLKWSSVRLEASLVQLWSFYTKSGLWLWWFLWCVQSSSQMCSSLWGQTETIVVPTESSELDDEPLVDSLEPVPVSEMHAISFLGALRIPVW